MSVQRDAARRFLVQAGLPLCHLASLTALIVEAERRGAMREHAGGFDRCPWCVDGFVKATGVMCRTCGGSGAHPAEAR